MCDSKTSPGGRQSFWRRFRPDDSEEPRSSGWKSGTSGGRMVWKSGTSGGRMVWLKVTKVFGRSETQRVPDESTTPNNQPGGSQSSRDGFEVSEVVKSRTLPLIQSTVDEDRQRYSPSPRSIRRTTTVRSPRTPPLPMRRPGLTPPASSRLAWESLRTPASRQGEVPPSPGTVSSTSDPLRTNQQTGVSADLLPEPEYLFRRFVDESTTQEMTTETDDVDESSIHDILDGYLSEDNIDDDYRN